MSSRGPIFQLETFLVEGRYRLVEICRSRQLLGNLSSPSPAFFFLSPGLDLIGVFICGADLLVEIRLDDLESFPAGPENDVI